MLKPTKHFKMPRSYAYLASTITDDKKRHIFKHMMIQATLYSELKPVKEKKNTSGRNVPEFE